MSSTFESLPDEILMIIFRYSGDALTTFRTYLGLNQRLNNILIDKRSHLLTDFLYINRHDNYYNSEIFHKVSQQLLSINTPTDEKTLCKILEPLLSYHLQQKYIEYGDELRSSLTKIKSIREQLDNQEFLKLNRALKTQFNNLRLTPLTKEHMKSIKLLVFTKGARLECEDYELGEYNLTDAVSNQFLVYLCDYGSECLVSFSSYFQLYKTFLISNPLLIKNRAYVGNGGCDLQYFIMHTLYQLRHVNHGRGDSWPIRMNCYRATVDLCLFVLQCWEQIPEDQNKIKLNMLDTLGMISNVNENMFIRTVQWEILRIMIDGYRGQECEQWYDYDKYRFTHVLGDLIENHRLDLFKYVYQHFRFRYFFINQNYTRSCLILMTRNPSGRKFCSMIMDEKSLDSLFPKKDLLFFLLEKKERKLFEKLIKLSPDLVHELDENGNDPLLYISLKVSGLRHRIIESLIKMDSDLQRRNSQGQNFEDTLQLPRNKKLSQKLYEYEIYASSSISRDTT